MDGFERVKRFCRNSGGVKTVDLWRITLDFHKQGQEGCGTFVRTLQEATGLAFCPGCHKLFALLEEGPRQRFLLLGRG